VPLELGRVVADVVDHLEAESAGVPPEDPGEHLADSMGDHLPVGERGVGRRRHGREAGLPSRRPERSAGQLTVADRDAVARHRLVEDAQVVPRLVELAVVGQIRLGDHTEDASPVEDHRAVVEEMVHRDRHADDGDEGPGPGRLDDPAERVLAGVDERSRRARGLLIQLSDGQGRGQQC
jgi:hypothetical protein